MNYKTTHAYDYWESQRGLLRKKKTDQKETETEAHIQMTINA